MVDDRHKSPKINIREIYGGFSSDFNIGCLLVFQVMNKRYVLEFTFTITLIVHRVILIS